MNGSAPPIESLPHGIRILCVDDEPMICDLLARFFESRLGGSVEAVHCGTDALLALARADFDVVILDFRMPGMNGAELYRHLAITHPELQTRVIFITGDTLTAATIDEIIATGRVYLEKPFGLLELGRAITQVLGDSAPAPTRQPAWTRP